MQPLPLIRLMCGAAVTLLGLVVLVANYMNVGYFADLGETAKQIGDDGTAGSLTSFVAGVLLIALGAAGAATSHLGAARASTTEREMDSPVTATHNG